jgi:hypothetical protein
MSESKKYTAGEAIAYAFLTPIIIGGLSLLALPILMWQAWAVERLWGWFGEPTFHTTASFWVIVGLLLIKSLVFSRSVYKGHKVDWKSDIMSTVLQPPIYVGLGWLIHSFMW